MHFSPFLTKATLTRRYKRFLADAVLQSGEEVVAHCANPGAMTGCAKTGSTIWLSPSSNPKAKLDWRWELVDVGTSLVLINTGRTNKIVEEALLAGQLPEVSDFRTVKREQKYGTGSRIDFLLEGSRPTYVEVKNVSLANGTQALFPDSVTARGLKHLKELSAMAQGGARSVMLYVVARGDCTSFSLADDIDPAYAAGFKAARDAGVEMMVYSLHITSERIGFDKSLPICLE